MKTLRRITFLFATVAAAFAADKAAPKIAANEAAKLVESGMAVLVDCREPAEWKDGVAKPAVLLPKSDFDAEQKRWKEFLAQNKGKQVILYCRGGGRASAVATALEKQGVKAASVGGLKDWTGAGLPTREVSEKDVAAAKK